MSVSNGQPADQNTFNDAFASKTDDNTMVGNQDLNDADVASGTQVTNVQREHNSIASYVGKTINAIKNALPLWVSGAVGTGTDDLTQRAEALTVASGVNAADISLRQLLSEKSQASGYASLDGTAKIPLAELPDAVVNARRYLGTWAASTNTPTLADGDPAVSGDEYSVSDNGTVDFGAGNIVFTTGDTVIYSGAVWQKIDGSTIDSVNGQQGTVVLDADDVGAANKTLSNLTSPTAVNQDLNFDATRTIRLKNGVKIFGRTLADDADIDLINTNSVNRVEVGDISNNMVLMSPNVLPNGSTANMGGGANKWNLYVGEVRTGLSWVSTANLSTADGTTTFPMRMDTGNSSAGISGSITLETGNALGGNSGNIDLSPGTSDATPGKIRLRSPSEGNIGEVWTSIGVNGEGEWAPAGGGGGDLWSDPVNANIVPDADGTRNVGATGTRFNIIFLNSLFVGSGPANGHRLVNSETMPSGATLFAGHRAEAGQGLGLYTIDQAATKDVSIESGNASGGNSGGINLQPGTATGTRGKISFKDGSETGAGAGAVWTQAAADGIGGWAAPSGGGAATDLNNLTATSVNQSLLPDTLNSRQLGDSTHKWSQVHSTIYNVYDNASTLQGYLINSALPSGAATRACLVGPASKQIGVMTDSISTTGVSSGGVNIETGNHIGSAGTVGTGNMLLRSGNTTVVTNNGNTGNVDITTGNAAGSTSGNSGSINLSIGTANAGTRGSISLDALAINHNQNPSTGFVIESGNTASRPAATLGAHYLDTDLTSNGSAAVPIWYDGSNWIDAAGNTV